MHGSSALALSAALCTALLAGGSGANPRGGATLPALEIADVTGQVHGTSEIRGKPALVIVLASSEAGAPASTWFDRARERFGTTAVMYVTLVSLDLSHLIPTGFARNAARQRTPREYWHTTWFEGSGSVRRAFGLSRNDRVPYVMAVDRNGAVRATVHREFDPAAAQTIWSALEANRSN